MVVGTSYRNGTNEHERRVAAATKADFVVLVDRRNELYRPTPSLSPPPRIRLRFYLVWPLANLAGWTRAKKRKNKRKKK